MALIIVESPTKARTFNKIFKISEDDQTKNKYFVFATMGHFRDLPHNKIAIDYQKNFMPDFEIMKNKIKVVQHLKNLAKENSEIILATDPDREGESIAYHVAYILGYIDENWPEISVKKRPIKRIVFHEITYTALKNALNQPEQLRINLVKAQMARRILDRIVGYELSPLLWKKMGKNWLSAGRVQSVALRIIVEREKEIKKFITEEYYQIFGYFKHQNLKTEEKDDLKSKLIKQNDYIFEEKKKIYLFSGDYTYAKTFIGEAKLQQIKTELAGDKFSIVDINQSVQTRYPPPPFTTSLLQQEAFQRFGFSSKMTMKIAQDLYEQGLITYHRTDSFNLSSQFVFGAKKYIMEKYGENYALEKPRAYRTKSRMAQEAHEAIRPTKFKKGPEKKQGKTKKKSSLFSHNHEKLYHLIFNRAVATQMKEAKIKIYTISIKSDKGYYFQSEKQLVMFDGFLRILNPDYIINHSKDIEIKVGDGVFLTKLEEEKLTTKPPPRYNEATLIKELEERGIGRPSTYAPIISLIQEKNYVEKDFRAFLPTKLGEAISDYLSSAFPDIFNLDFTASMEDGLDKIAENKQEFISLLNNFYQPFKKELEIRKADDNTIDVEEEINDKCSKCESPLVVRFSRFGKFLACSKYPKCKFTKSFLKPIANKKCPQCGGSIISRFTKTRKRFYGCINYPDCKFSSWTLAGIK